MIWAMTKKEKKESEKSQKDQWDLLGGLNGIWGTNKREEIKRTPNFSFRGLRKHNLRKKVT